MYNRWSKWVSKECTGVCSYCDTKAVINPSHNQRILEHMAAHIQHDPTLSPTQEVCGLCLQPSPLCQIFLKKWTDVKGTYQVNYMCLSCPNLSTSRHLQYTQAAKSTSGSPCSNVPVICPLCMDHAAAVWTHCLELHFTISNLNQSQ